MHNKITLFSAVLALATLGISIIMLYLMPAQATLSNGFYTPIIAFEFAQSHHDLLFLSGDVANREGMYRGLHWDMLFPFAYAGLLFLLLLPYRNAKSPTVWLGMLFSLLAIPADIYENWVLLSILDALTEQHNTALLLAELHTATWLKWGAMGIGFAALAMLDFKNNKKLHLLFSLLAALSVLICFLSQSKPLLTELMMLCFTLFYAFHIPRCCYQFHTGGKA